MTKQISEEGRLRDMQWIQILLTRALADTPILLPGNIAIGVPMVRIPIWKYPGGITPEYLLIEH